MVSNAFPAYLKTTGTLQSVSAMFRPLSFLHRPALSGASFIARQIASPVKVAVRHGHQYSPKFQQIDKKHKGRVPVRIGGSIKGSILKFGQYGLRLRSNGTRMTAIQLQQAEEAIMKQLRPVQGKLWSRLSTSIAVCVKGNETRMGKGKGAFDHWMVRVPTGKIVFEIGGSNLHVKVARDALRRAGTKLPGVFDIVTGEDQPVVGRTKVPIPIEKPNYFEEAIKNPNKKMENLMKSKLPEYREYKP